MTWIIEEIKRQEFILAPNTIQERINQMDEFEYNEKITTI